MEPCLFWSSCCWKLDSLLASVCVSPKRERHHNQDCKPLFSAHVDSFWLCRSHSMQLKVRKQLQGTDPSGSQDPQRQVDISFPVVAPCLTMLGCKIEERMWGLDYFQHLPQQQRPFSQPEPVLGTRRGMGPASLQEDRELEKECKKEMESYHFLLQAGSQLESTLQREYTWCWLSLFHFY